MAELAAEKSKSAGAGLDVNEVEWTWGEIETSHLMYCDTKLLLRWLHEQGFLRIDHHGYMLSRDRYGDSHARRVREWRNPDCTHAYIYVVDRLLIKLDHHLSDLPDQVWVERPRNVRRGGPVLQQQRQRREVGREMLLAGKAEREVSDELLVSMRAVYGWRMSLSDVLGPRVSTARGNQNARGGKTS